MLRALMPCGEKRTERAREGGGLGEDMTMEEKEGIGEAGGVRGRLARKEGGCREGSVGGR